MSDAIHAESSGKRHHRTPAYAEFIEAGVKELVKFYEGGKTRTRREWRDLTTLASEDPNYAPDYRALREAVLFLTFWLEHLFLLYSPGDDRDDGGDP